MDWILFWEIGGGPGVKQYATFDAAQLSTRIELELSNLQVTHTADVDLLTSAAISIGPTVASGERVYLEAVCYGKPAADGLAGSRFRVGLWNPSVDPTTNDPGAGDCYTYDPDTGEVTVDESVFATLPAVEVGTVIGLDVDRTVSPSVLRIWGNGALLGEVELDFDTDPEDGWAFHASVAGDEAFVNRVFMNFGQRAFEYPVPDGARAGLYSESTAPELVRIATETFVTASTDTPADTTYDGRLSESFDVTAKRSVRQWTWGRSGGESKPADIEILNGDGKYDVLLSDGYRDQPAVGKVLERGRPFAEAITICTNIVDQVVADGENLIRVRQRDKLSKLDVPLQRRLFLPSVSDNAANTPVPITLGTARNTDPVLYDEENLAYRLNDQPLNSIIVVRDKGDPLLPGEVGSPTIEGDWLYTDRMDGFILQESPLGKVTADVSSTGGSGIDPTPDVLTGVGDPFVWSAPTTLTGWGDVSYNVTDGSGGQHKVQEPASGGIQLSRALAGDASVTAYAGVLNELTPGQLYRYRISIREFVAGSSSVTLNISAGKVGASTRYAQLRGVGAFTGTFLAESDDIYLTLSFDTFDKTVQVNSFSVETITAVDPESYDDPVAGITLPDFAEEIIERRALFESAEWSRLSAELVDVAGYDCGIYQRNEITCRGALDLILDAYAGWYFQDAEGVIRFGQLFDPATDSAETVAFFTQDDVIGDIQVELDRAPGLSTSIACRRNWSPYNDSDFVDDFDDVPANLRARFRRTFQYVRSSSANLAETYQHARQAAPVETLIDDPEDAQAEIDRVCALYTQQRQFVRFTIGVLDGSEFTIEPGDVVSITYPRFGMDAGKRILILDVVPTALRGQVELYGWF